MTDGHKHREVKVTEDGLVMRVLCAPLLHFRAENAVQIARIDRSPYPFGPCPLTDMNHPTCYYISALSVLHRWTGLTLTYEPAERVEP